MHISFGPFYYYTAAKFKLINCMIRSLLQINIEMFQCVVSILYLTLRILSFTDVHLYSLTPWGRAAQTSEESPKLLLLAPLWTRFQMSFRNCLFLTASYTWQVILGIAFRRQTFWKIYCILSLSWVLTWRFETCCWNMNEIGSNLIKLD